MVKAEKRIKNLETGQAYINIYVINGWTLESQLLAFLTLLEQVLHAEINLSGKFGAHIRQ